MTPIYSSSISGFCRRAGVFDALKEIRQAGFDAVDFPLSVYSRKADSPLCSNSWWRSWTEAVSGYAKELSLEITQAHAPWEQTIAADLHYEAPAPVYARIFEACEILGCRHLVFHPVPYPHRIVSAQTLEAIHQYNLRWFSELLPYAEKYGVTIELENTFDYYHLRMPSDPQLPHITAEQLIALADGLNSPYVGICLDTGHANIAGQDIPQMIRAFGTRLHTLHLNDNFGKRSGVNEDLHLFPGDGNIAWEPVMAALRETGFAGALNIEPIASLPESTPAQRAAQLRQGRRWLQTAYEIL